MMRGSRTRTTRSGMPYVKCPCCRRMVALNMDGRFRAHNGGRCKCPPTDLCEESGRMPPSIAQEMARKIIENAKPGLSGGNA